MKNNRFFVRGKHIELTASKFNQFYGLNDLPRRECAYQNRMEDHELMQINGKLCPLRGEWHIRKGKSLSLESKHLEWHEKILIPAKHHSNVTRDRAILTYCILEGECNICEIYLMLEICMCK